MRYLIELLRRSEQSLSTCLTKLVYLFNYARMCSSARVSCTARARDPMILRSIQSNLYHQLIVTYWPISGQICSLIRGILNGGSLRLSDTEKQASETRSLGVLQEEPLSKSSVKSAFLPSPVKSEQASYKRCRRYNKDVQILRNHFLDNF